MTADGGHVKTSVAKGIGIQSAVDEIDKRLADDKHTPGQRLNLELVKAYTLPIMASLSAELKKGAKGEQELKPHELVEGYVEFSENLVISIVHTLGREFGLSKEVQASTEAEVLEAIGRKFRFKDHPGAMEVKDIRA